MQSHRVVSATALTILAGLGCLLLQPGAPRAADEVKTSALFELKPKERICIIGNTLADRMQHDGWLETLIQTRFPNHELVFRDLGFAADELTTRPRSQNFGTPDHWLTFNKADIVIAFFGYNESFAGEAGLPKFKTDLQAFIKTTLAAKYNGKAAPRLVLCSPIAHEDLKDRNLPNGVENNKRIELYTAAMAEVAKDAKVPFVDLYQPTKIAYTKAAKPLTINGVHLNEEGNRVVAEAIDSALFGTAPKRDAKAVEKLRAAVKDKDFHWYQRYRTTDGFSIYGGRRDEPRNGQRNREVCERELEILDIMTVNRDKRVWAVAQGNDLKVDDSNTPDFIHFPTNKPGKGPQGTHIFIDGETAIGHMKVGKGLKVNLFASEKEFPELAKPVQMSFDAQGRLWVAVWPSYPHWKPKEEMNDKIIILEDTDGDGKADKLTVFADKLHNPTGFEFWNGGVLVAQAPDIMFLKDTDGDGKADVRTRVLSGMDTADTHHTANSFVLDPGGAMYWQEGVFHHTGVETPYGPPVRCFNAGVFRYEPRTQKFDAYARFGFANPHGHAFDRWGQDIIVDGTGANPYQGGLISVHLNSGPNDKHPHPPQVYQQRTRPCPGIEFLSSKHFPAESQGNLLVANVIGVQGILQYKMGDKGAGLSGTEGEPILTSSDPNFRPSDLKIGPDGALYFIDWHNPIIGHLQHNLRDPSRDRTHGRVYRVTVDGRPLDKPVKIAGEPIEKLLDVLKSSEDRVRARARIELTGRKSEDVVAGAKKWVGGLQKNDPDYEHHVLEALWLHQSHNYVDVDLLKQVLASPEPRARAAATRVLSYWHDRIPETLDLLRKLAADPNPRVRLEAVRASSFLTVPEAVEVALVSNEHPSDPYLDYTRTETMRALDKYVKEAISKKQPIKFTTTAGARFFLKSVSTDDLAKLDLTQGVCIELLFRRGVRDEQRTKALAGLAKLESKPELDVLLNAIKQQDEAQSAQDESVVFDLVRLLTSRKAEDLTKSRAELEKMATSAKLPVTRQLGYVALIAADANVNKAWAIGVKSAPALRDLVDAMPLIRDPGQRASLYPKVLPLLDGLPKELATGSSARAVMGRFVRVELPGDQKTLTLAEVEVYSDGKNVARQGKASQSSTAHGGDASKGIDGNKNGSFGGGGQTHTQENTKNPWWEVDLGQEYPINQIVIYNRTDGDLGRRLRGFNVIVKDNGKNVVFRKDNNGAPNIQATFEVGGSSPEQSVRRAAMLALTSVRGQEEATFKALAKFVKDDANRAAAIQAIQRIPTRDWPKDDAKPLLDTILAYVAKVPTAERTTPAVLDALQLGDSLAAQLPPEQAKAVRRQLGELGVRVLRVGTITDQMLFDKERLAVKAGKPFEIIFENTDLMPHNLVIVKPGALEEVGTLAEAQAAQPGALERHYVPNSNKVLKATKLVQPRNFDRLGFTAPAEPGVYPYVCTYPGHWRRMFGALYVVADLEEYLADPEGYLAKHPLTIKDDLLKFNRPRKEWKYDDLAQAVETMENGRSFANGKQMFTVANCVACHKMNNVGQEIGPDLAKYDEKWKPVEILKDILEPSFRINEKYQTYVIETDSGKTYTGLVTEEGDVVKVLENPLAKQAAVMLKKSQITSKQKSPNSIMPKGMMDKLTREEILDLVAYVIARGDQKHKLFQGGHEGHKH